MGGYGRPNINVPKDQLKVYPYATRKNAQPVPQEELCEAPLVCLKINAHWASHVIGVLDALVYEDAWSGTTEEIERAIETIREVQDMLNCGCDDGSLTETTNINNKLYQQMLINIYEGDLTNVDIDAPDINFDLGTNDDVGDSQSRDDALCATCQTFVDQICELAIANIGNTSLIVEWIVGLAASVFSGNPIIGMAVVASIRALSGLGQAVLSDEFARELVACCMYDALKGQPNTRENLAASLDNCEFFGNVNAELIRSTIDDRDLSAQGNWLAFNKALAENFRYAAAALLEPCPCETWCQVFDFTVGQHGWTAAHNDNFIRAQYVAGSGWRPNSHNYVIWITSPVFDIRTITKVTIYTDAAINQAGAREHTIYIPAWTQTSGSFDDYSGVYGNGVFHEQTVPNVETDQLMTGINNAFASLSARFIWKLELCGRGTNPFGS